MGHMHNIMIILVIHHVQDDMSNSAHPNTTEFAICTSLVPRPSPALVFDHLEYAKTEQM